MLDQRYSDNEQSKRDIPSFIEPRPPLIQNPFMRPRPQKGTNLLELFEDDSELEEPELVQVYLRLKPCNEASNLYEVRSDRCLVTSLDTATAGHGRRTQHNVSKMYTFSRIFRPDCTQKEIFEQVVKDNLKKLPDGQSFTLLTYGASGSGKTYTLMGTVNSPGLVPRSLEYVFKLVDAAQQPLFKPGEAGAEKLSLAEQDFELQWVKRLRHVSAPLRDKYRRMSAQLHRDMTISSVDLTNRTRYFVWVSFVEIYNEAIYDLLSPPEKRTKLRIREDSSGNVYVKGVTQAFVRSGEEAYDVMVAGKHNLIVAATGVHAQSSRSHCIFTITMLTEIDGEVRWSMVRLCDLAGCERARATRNTGARMQESRAINSSLHVLERCLHTLRRRQRARNRADALVPYRESKLTRLLGSGLSGARGEAVSMVVTLNPSPEYAQETKHVLTLAAVAQDIQINNTMLTTTLESSTQDVTIESSAEVMRLRSENERLHFELVQAQSRNKELLASMEVKQQQASDTMRELVEEAKDITRQFYESQLRSLRTEMEEMEEEYESRLAMKSAAPSTDTGTPSRYLQAKVAQLMTEIAVLEEKLTAEHLARSRAEKEVQHLRDCIEERDEKAFKDNNCNEKQEVMTLTDSEHESDEEHDIFNESLEPVFKKENINKSHCVIQDDVKQNLGEQAITEFDKSNDTLQNESLHDSTKDSAYAGGDDESDFNKKVDDLTDSLVDTSAPHNNYVLNDKNGNVTMDVGIGDCNIKPITTQSEFKNDDNKNDNYEIPVENEKYNMETINEISEDANDTNKSDSRGTYCVPHDPPLNVVKEVEFKKPSLFRGTYCVKEIDKQSQDKFVLHSEENGPLQKEVTGMAKTDSYEQKLAQNDKETLVSKIIKSIKSQGSDSSLRQFELLEMEANICDESRNNAGDFGEVRFLKEKRTYFDDANETTKQKVQGKVEKVKQIFEDKSKEQPKEFFDVKINKDFSRDQAKELFDIKVNKEKRTYFDNIDVNLDVPTSKKINHKTDDNVNVPTNKKINYIISQNTDERSPSIVKEHVGNDFEPSKIKKLLGDSLTKPDFLSAKHKNTIVKKHDSVDIFEGYDSPHLNKPKDCINDYENVMKSVEKLRLMGEDKVDVKREIKMEAFSSIDAPIIEDGKPQQNPPEINISNAQTETNVNNTIDEFENLYKDVTESRATEFELLVSQDMSNIETKKTEINIETKETEINIETKETEINIETKETEINIETKETESNIETKETESNIETKETEINIETKETESNIETKETESNIETKETESNIETKETESNIETKETESNIETKETESNIETKETESNIETKETESNIETKETEINIETKETESNIETKETESNIETKETESNIETKETESNIETKETESNIETKETESNIETKETESNTENKETDAEQNVVKIQQNENKQIQFEVEEEKYNLRKTQSKTAKSATTTKRSLRLKRRNHVDEDQEVKLKDIVNLQEEFSDVTMDVPAAKKDIKDIPSPEKCTEEENLPPLLGIQSCPSKSVTRSRRKLFTPRAEPLEESLSQTGDSNERIYVPRPSYHRTRARRKL